LNHNLYFVYPDPKALFLVYFVYFMALHKWQNFVLQLPMDHTVLLNFAELFHCVHVCVGSCI